MKAYRNSPAAALNQYATIDVRTSVETASPHRLTEMLLNGALARVATARGNMQRGEFASKGEQIGWAISIVGGLRESLNLQAGGQLAANLDALYEYITRRLLEANLNDNPAYLEEVQALLSEIRTGWTGIRDQVEGTSAARTVG